MTDELRINWSETKKLFDDKYSQARIARGMGINKVTFCQILNGNYPHMGSARAKAVVAKLAELGVLVRSENSAVEKAA